MHAYFEYLKTTNKKCGTTSRRKHLKKQEE
jgi:hypothetical protein